MKRPLLGALVIVIASACDPKAVVLPAPGQILLHVDTDAPVPDNRVARLPSDVAPLFDRLRIEVIAPGETSPCDECTNEFSVDQSVFAGLTASVGIAPPPGAMGYRARVRLFYRALVTEDAAPDPDATIESVIALPVVPEHGQIDVTVVLLTDSVGVPPSSLDAPAAPVLGSPKASLVGTWPEAKRLDCETNPPPGKVCVPGGAYWMGDRRKLFAVLPDFDVNRARLIVLSPFFMDAHEVTVAEFRADPIGRADNPRDDANGDVGSDFCTFTRLAGPRENLPVNCISWGEARGYCQRHGGDLPTEAQFEFVASGMQNHSFVWGDDQPTCEDAVYSRVGWGAFKDSLATCRPPTPFGGPEASGRGLRDRLTLPSGEIVDLIGNVNEWERDVWNDANEPCWSHPGVYFDPRCIAAGALGPKQHAIRGGSWGLNGGQLDRTSRSFAADTTTLLDTGFRCVVTQK